MKTISHNDKHARMAVRLALAAVNHSKKGRGKPDLADARTRVSDTQRVKISRWVQTKYNVSVTTTAECDGGSAQKG